MVDHDETLMDGLPLAVPPGEAKRGAWIAGTLAALTTATFTIMVPAMLVSVAFVAMLISVHRCASDQMKLFSLLGLVLGGSGAMILATDYWVQLAVIQPSLLKGEQEGMSRATVISAR